MKVAWDESKNLANQAKHGVSFEDAEYALGMVLKEMNRNPDAVSSLRESARLHEGMGNLLEAGCAFSQLGDVLAAQEQRGEAIKALERSLELLTRASADAQAKSVEAHLRSLRPT